MNEALDSFLNVSTWHTLHPEDERRFFCALKGMVSDPVFCPEAMGEYIDAKLNLNEFTEDHAYRRARDHYVDAAWAVKRFLEAAC